MYSMELGPGFRQKLTNYTELRVGDKPKCFPHKISLFRDNLSAEKISNGDSIILVRSISAIFPNLTHLALKSVAMGEESEKSACEKNNENDSETVEEITNVESSSDFFDTAEKVENRSPKRSMSRFIVQTLFKGYCDMNTIENEIENGTTNENRRNLKRDVDGQHKRNEAGSSTSRGTESGRLVQSAGSSIVLLAFAEANQGDDESKSAGGGCVQRSSPSVNLTEAVLEITAALQSESSTSLRSQLVISKRVCAANLLTVLVQSLLCPATSTSSYAPSSIPQSIFLSVTQQLVDGLVLLLRAYELFLASALYGMGDFEPSVRAQCGAVLRMLVPLAPIARERTVKPAPYVPPIFAYEDECSVGDSRGEKPDKKTEIRFTMTQQEKMSKLIENLLSRKPLQRLTDSTDHLDEYLLNELASKTHLLPIFNSVNKPYKKASVLKGFENVSKKKVYVRPYQWDGVSWLLQLYRCGLGGILAGDECRA